MSCERRRSFRYVQCIFKRSSVLICSNKPKFFLNIVGNWLCWTLASLEIREVLLEDVHKLGILSTTFIVLPVLVNLF